MNHLSEKYFTGFKYVSEDRLNNGGMYTFNISTLLFSGITVGIPFFFIMKSEN
ncbi:hypothetical protein [Rummeliibacillus pycnus]|uniref:hypothetical protein n=1 Tax=Rummeliibacillus pycnus TaxID=101070 RepID=UPI003D2DF820